MNNVIITIKAEVNPTEDEKKVIEAVQNIFQQAILESIPQHCGESLVAKIEGIECLSILKDLIKKERIFNASKRLMLKGLRDNSLFFFLNKQAAYMKRVSFCETEDESPLGPIRIEVNCDNPKEIIRWITSETR
ncbi:MAG: uncharacterized protein QG670_175 [Thermoproteota archaeon]|nr:uncharacterized protein [Thermoproteota archaeon]